MRTEDLNIDTKIVKAFKQIYWDNPKLVMIGTCWGTNNRAAFVMYIRPDFDQEIPDTHEGYEVIKVIKPYGQGICP